MSRAVSCLAGASLLFAAVATAQQTDPPKKNTEPVGAEVRLMDGSSIRMLVVEQQIEVKTDYGTLTVPIKDVVRIDFGVHLPDGLDAKIAKAIDQLGDGNYRVRETALKSLIDWGPYAYPQVYRAAKSDTPEVAKRAATALEKIRAKHAADKLRLRDDDIVVTTKFTMAGRITTPQIKAKNDTIGELSLDLCKLRLIRWINPTVETEVVVDAAKHGSAPNAWMDTGFEYQGGAKLQITATGTVDLWPQGGGGGGLNSGYVCGPRGQGMGGGPGGGGFGGQYARPGTLMGRIGEDGTPFIIGDNYESAPTREGKLYLHIIPSPWNCDSAGAYKVRITPRTDAGGE